MMNNVITGIFGKLPAHGDFVQRNLPTDFVTLWDEWLQQYITGSQEQIGEDWLSIYLTSPVWRFMLSEGTIDENAWSGIFLPSVDKIGRYFPFSVLTKLPTSCNPLDFLLAKNNWLDSIEALTIQALMNDTSIDNLMQLIDEVDINYSTIYCKATKLSVNNPIVINMEKQQQSGLATSGILDAVLQKSYSSYSAWSTTGSEKITPVTFYSQGLPASKGISSMMNGQWQQSGWQQPYKLNDQ